MLMAMRQFRATRPELPEAVKWDDPGYRVEFEYRGMKMVSTKNGERVIHLMYDKVDGREKAIFETEELKVLRAAKVGSMVAIEYHGWRKAFDVKIQPPSSRKASKRN